MSSGRPAGVLLLALLFSCGALFFPKLCADNAAPAAPGDSALLTESDYAAFHRAGPEAGKVDFSIQPLNQLGYSSVLHLTTKEACTAAYSAQIGQACPRAIHKGDVVLAHFYLRTLHSSIESQEGTTELVIEDTKSYAKSLQFRASALGEWREFFVPFTADTDYAPGQASIILRAGFQPQEIEIAGLVIRDFGPVANLAAPPVGVVRLKYDGQAADAPWRAAAEARIEKIRKAGLIIRVVDGAGHPVPGAELTVQQTKHAFWFGSAVRADKLVDPAHPDDQAKYRAAVAEMFNVVTFENDLKWAFWQRDLNATLASDRWLHDQGIALRGHVLVWPSREKGLPPALFPLFAQPDQLRQAILDHIRDVTAQLQPPAEAWDVLNEPFTNHAFMDVLGRDAMATWFQAARQDSPGSRLFINDWGILSSHGADVVHQADYEKNIAFLLDHHAPLDGIGMQGHFGVEPTAPDVMLRILDRFGKFGKEIQLTEYTTQFVDPNDAAAYLRDCLTVIFSHPATTGFILWGFRDGVGMPNKSFLYDKNWNLTPSGQVWKDLVYGKWWTQAQAVSAADGSAEVSGFLGQYKITARHAGLESVATIELKPGGSAITIVLADKATAQTSSN
jgi:GH35 family endo-1,4-beta-xylanase